MEAEREGVKIIYLAGPVEFIGVGKVERLICVKRNSERRMRREDAVLCLSRAPIRNKYRYGHSGHRLCAGCGNTERSGLDINRKGTVIVKDDSGTTNLDGVFAAGDVVSGPQSVIEAMASGRKVLRRSIGICASCLILGLRARNRFRCLMHALLKE